MIIHTLIEVYEDRDSGEARYWGFELDKPGGVARGYKSYCKVTGKSRQYHVVSNDFKLTGSWAKRIAILFHAHAVRVSLNE